MEPMQDPTADCLPCNPINTTLRAQPSSQQFTPGIRSHLAVCWTLCPGDTVRITGSSRREGFTAGTCWAVSQRAQRACPALGCGADGCRREEAAGGGACSNSCTTFYHRRAGLSAVHHRAAFHQGLTAFNCTFPFLAACSSGASCCCN